MATRASNIGLYCFRVVVIASRCVHDSARNSSLLHGPKIGVHYKEFEHPLWCDYGERAKASGHGGGDFLCFYRAIEALITGTYADIDVYDTVLWSPIVDLSEQSARNRSKLVDCSDFTRGRWKTWKPLAIRGMSL